MTTAATPIPQTLNAFNKPISPDRPAPTVEPDSLADPGLIVKHVGTRVVEYKRDGQERKSSLHMFASRGGNGRWFSVFGSPNLNSQLRKAKPGAVLLLCYRGKQKEEGTDREVHTWDVAETVATVAQVTALRNMEWKEREAAFDAIIDAAAAAERERMEARRQGGQGAAPEPPPPPHTDDDVPF